MKKEPTLQYRISQAKADELAKISEEGQEQREAVQAEVARRIRKFIGKFEAYGFTCAR